MFYNGKVLNGQIVVDGAEKPPEGAKLRIEQIDEIELVNGVRVGSPEAILQSRGFWAGEDEEVDRLLAELKEMKQAEVERQLQEPELEL